jgi:CBS domain-containing protein
VRELMTPRYAALAPGASLPAAAARMRARDASAAVVLDGPRLVGILTERDLARCVADEAGARGGSVADYMTHDPLTIGPDEEARDAAAVMADRRVRHLPVLDGGEVVGLISARDLLELGLPTRCLDGEPW